MREPGQRLVFVIEAINCEPEGSIYCDSYFMRCVQTGEAFPWSTGICHDYLIKISRLEALIQCGVQI